MITDANLKPFYIHIHEAAETMQDEWEERYVPSPSGIASCRLRQWFQGQHIERTDRVPVESQKKMESGTAIEDYWRKVYTRAGFHVVSPTPALTIGDMRSKGGDGILYVAQDKLSSALGLAKGSAVLLELKDLGVWSYIDFVTKGLQEWSADYEYQTQTYLHGYDLPYAIFHAGMADASATKWIWKRIKKLEGDPPPFWIEIVPRRPAIALKAMERAQEVRWAIDNVSPDKRIPIELRDYDAVKMVADNKYPCGWCGWKTACVGGTNVVRLEDYRGAKDEANT